MKNIVLAAALALMPALSQAAWTPWGYEDAVSVCHKIIVTKEYKPNKNWCNPGPMSPYLGACRVSITWVDHDTWTAMSCIYNAVD